MSTSRCTLVLLASLLLAAPALAQSEPARSAPDTTASPDSLVRGGAAAPLALPGWVLGSWTCRRETADYEPPIVLELRADGRWADRSTSRAVVARWEWDGTTLRLLRAGGDVRHAMRADGGRLVSDAGIRCGKTGGGSGDGDDPRPHPLPAHYSAAQRGSQSAPLLRVSRVAFPPSARMRYSSPSPSRSLVNAR